MSAKLDYRPMGPAPKEVSQERMQEILARRSGKNIGIPTEAPRPQLKWLEHSRGVWVTECGRYSIVASREAADSPHKWRYTCCYRVGDHPPPIWPPYFSPEDAKAFCEQHRKDNP